MKEGMNSMFIKNDRYGRFVNGNRGKLLRINYSGEDIISISVLNQDSGDEFELERDEVSDYDTDDYGNILESGRISNFPIKPAYAITVGKSQGLTLPKIVLFLGRNIVYDNQIYVALSRVRNLDDIILDRPITYKDIHISPFLKQFYDSIVDRIIPVEDKS
jgi:ATP-dependent exoDNAse (exonuclease V) alpha subunit